MTVTPLARIAVIPVCPACGLFCLFEREATTVDDLVPVVCSGLRCEWRGLSQKSIDAPHILLTVAEGER